MLLSLPAASNLTAEHLAAAEALIAGELGVASLEREEGVAESGTVGSSGLIVLGRPAVSVQTLTLGGAPAAGVLRNSWTLDVGSLVQPSYGSPWGSGYTSVPYTVTYTAGWTEEDLPPGIRQAILSAAAVRAAVPVGIKSESMGPVSRTYTEPGTISADVLALLRPWLPLRF